jgi:hypothetical protein
MSSRLSEAVVEPLEAIDRILELLALAHQLLGFLRIIPDRRIFSLGVQPFETFLSRIPVKDASSAGLWPA